MLHHASLQHPNLLSALNERKMMQENETELYTLARKLSVFVTNHTNDILVEQYRLSRDLRFAEVTTMGQRADRVRVFYVRSATKAPSKVSHRRPLYARTRVVTVKEIVGPNGPKLVFSCSCGHFFLHMCACRHMYCILDRQPNDDDVFPDKCKSYEAKYHKDDNFRRNCDQRTHELEQAGGIVVNQSLENITLDPK